MIETMRAAPGVGLAAPQVGVSERLIMVEFAEPPEEDPQQDEPGNADAEPAAPPKEVKPKLYVMLNPEIVKNSGETVIGVEGCLSIPGLVGEVERFSTIHIKGQNRRGQPMKVKAEGWLARIFQHEIDHINGVVFPDRATRVWQPEPDEVENLA
jgi:peptide deformylase